MNLKRARRFTAAIATVAAAGLVLSGCVYLQIPTGEYRPSQPQSSGGPDVDLSIPEGLEDYYTQDVDWSECGDGFECAMIEVPLDYENPDDRAIELSVVRHLAEGKNRVGSLITNPGGPGGSGIGLVRDSFDYVFGSELIDNFDIVGFDPRGVGESTPVTCLDGDDMDAYNYDIPPGKRGSDEWYEFRDAAAEDFAKACEENSDGILEFITTENSARDIDVLRGVLGDEELYYLGFSYGTFLGATYAELFPDQVGRLVLDGAMDPTVRGSEVGVTQMIGFESALRAYMESCLAGDDCPFSGTTDQALKDLNALLASVDAKPLELSDGRKVGGDSLVLGILTALYSEDSWPYLTMALDGALSGDGEIAMLLADTYNGREGEGRYADNSTESFTAYNCMDYPDDSTVEENEEADRKIREEAPTIAEFTTGGSNPCAFWAYPPSGTRKAISASGAAPIVVLGTTNDPATPYQWSVNLAEQLESGVLVTREGEGHTGYYKGNSCVDEAIEAYLVNGDVPKDGLTCSA